jgi:two-component system chemotaxis response regulator CheB
MKKMIIADNSAIFKGYLKDILEENGDFEVVKLTANGEDVLQTLNESSIDLVITGHDISMINEIEISKMIMNNNPVPVVIISDNISSQDRKDLAEFNLVLIMSKPPLDQLQIPSFRKNLINMFKRHSETIKTISIDRSYKHGLPNGNEFSGNSIKLIVVGASTGGPKALQHIFSNLPENFPVGIALVQHFEQGFEQGFADWLNSSSKMNIRIAYEKDFPAPGEIIIAPQGVHMKAVGHSLILEDGPKVNNQKPAIDVLFSTAASMYRDNVLAILLTGMGKDGGKGCFDIYNNGGFTIVQDEESSIVYGMPKEAVSLGAASVILPYQNIAEYLVKKFNITGDANDISK